MAAPVIQLDHRDLELVPRVLEPSVEPRRLSNDTTQYEYAGAVADDLTLRLRIRIADDNPVVRFQYVLESQKPRHLTKTAGRDRLRHLGLDLSGTTRQTEVRFSEFKEAVHSFTLSEVPLTAGQFENELAVMGPMLVAADGRHAILVAYEHGSQVPDAFLHFALGRDHRVELRAVKGNYWAGRVIGPDQPFETVWFQLAAVEGDEAALAAAYRDFVLNRFTFNSESRKPYIFYNTWNFQERNKWWNGRPYLESMNQDRMLAEIDVAHRMGIDVFVIDTGWYEKTGDWRVSRQRFPDGMKPVREKLESHGMKLGLWFDNAAAVSSQILNNHRDCVISRRGKIADPHPIWETEPAHRMCLASRYADAFADELIRLNREVGVTYFKWDAIGQYGCDSSDHFHGTAENSEQERADCYAFELGRWMIRIVDKVCAACPEAIVDFDVTEGGRFVGLGFLAAGKYFLVNNGPYYRNYDIPVPPPGNSNMFFWPGQARGWICRTPLDFDKWIPSVLFMTHYFPDDPEENQWASLASLLLGQNGIWGDLPKVSPEGVERFGRVLRMYKQIRDDVTRASPVRTGAVGGSPEIHEKIDERTGRGIVSIFATASGEYTYVTRRKVDTLFWSGPGAEIRRDEAGRAVITARFEKAGARLAMFGVRPE